MSSGNAWIGSDELFTYKALRAKETAVHHALINAPFARELRGENTFRHIPLLALPPMVDVESPGLSNTRALLQAPEGSRRGSGSGH